MAHKKKASSTGKGRRQAQIKCRAEAKRSKPGWVNRNPNNRTAKEKARSRWKHGFKKKGKKK